MGLAGNVPMDSVLHKVHVPFMPGGRIRFGKHFENSRMMIMMIIIVIVNIYLALSVGCGVKHFICSISFNYSNFPVRWVLISPFYG